MNAQDRISTLLSIHDLFPDWDEIALKVKLVLTVSYFLFIVVAYAVLFETGLAVAHGVKWFLLVLSSLIVGFLLFMSMFVFDWESVLP